MPNTQLHDLARMGAQSRLAALDQERHEILKMFPELRNGAGRDGTQPNGRTTKSRTMSAAERKAVSKRMRAYWAERRAKKAGARKSSAKKSASAAKRKGGMSAEARKAQGERMKAYWAAKRAAQPAGAQAEATEATNGTSSSKKQRRKAGRMAGGKRGRRT